MSGRLSDMVLKSPSKIEIPPDVIAQILADAGIHNKIAHIGEPNAWIMQSQRVYLDNGKVLLLKTSVMPEWTTPEAIQNQVNITRRLREIGFVSQPEILSNSSDLEKYGFRFILSDSFVGDRLITAYKQSSDEKRKELYQALASAYGKLHSVTNEWAGLWAGSFDKKLYPIHPAQFYSYAELHNGSCKYLLDHDIIEEETYQQIGGLWDNNLEYLMNRPASLIHVSPFPWSIYLLSGEVSGFAALADFMWWDAMSDVAHILYPPFMDITDEERDAFIAAYPLPIDMHAVRLYSLLNRVCAMANCYFAPIDHEEASNWIMKQKAFLYQTIESLR